MNVPVAQADAKASAKVDSLKTPPRKALAYTKAPVP